MKQERARKTSEQTSSQGSSAFFGSVLEGFRSIERRKLEGKRRKLLLRFSGSLGFDTSPFRSDSPVCIRRIATPPSSVEKSNPRLGANSNPVDMSVRRPAGSDVVLPTGNVPRRCMGWPCGSDCSNSPSSIGRSTPSSVNRPPIRGSCSRSR